MSGDLPEGWAWATLGDIADSNLGKMLDRKKGGGHPVPYLRNVNVQWGRVDMDDILTMSIPPEDQEFFRVRKGDLLVCEGGEVGRCAIFTHDDSEYIAFQKALHRVRPRGGVSALYIRYYLEHLNLQNGLAPFSTGSTIKHLPQQQLKRLPIKLPPLDEQQRIVAVLEEQLSRLDAAQKILVNAAQRVELTQRSILNQFFSEASVAKHGWALDPLEKVAEIRGGNTPRKGEIEFQAAPSPTNLPFWKVGDMNDADGRYLTRSRTYIDYSSTESARVKICPEGTVLIPKRGGAIATNKKRITGTRGTYDLNTMGIIPGHQVTSDYLWYWFQNIDLRDLADGSNVPQINNPDLRHLLVPVPNKAEQDRIVEHLDAVFSRLRATQELAASSKAILLRNSLLRDAFAGRLVPQDPTDEPAEALLARIRAEREAAAPRKRTRRTPAPRKANDAAAPLPTLTAPLTGQQTALEIPS